jgi:hypothetical protein
MNRKMGTSWLEEMRRHTGQRWTKKAPSIVRTILSTSRDVVVLGSGGRQVHLFLWETLEIHLSAHSQFYLLVDTEYQCLRCHSLWR